MGLGGHRHGHMHGRRGHFGRRGGFHGRRFRGRPGFHHHYRYGVHTRPYYGNGEEEQVEMEPQQPPYIILFETQSQFQKIKIVEFTNQVAPQMIQPMQVITIPNNNEQKNNNDELPSYNPNSISQPQTQTIQQQVHMQQQIQQQQPMVVTTNGGNTQPIVQTGQSPILVSAVPMNVVKHRGLVLNDEIQFSTLDEKPYHNSLVDVAMNFFLGNNYHTYGGLRALVIGGGDGGCLRELTKYSDKVITEIIMIEIDELVISTCKTHFPAMTIGYNDKRVNLIISDALAWINVQTTQSKIYQNYFDLIVLDLTEDGTLSSPLIKNEFWNSLSLTLKNTGIMVRNGYHKPKFNNPILQNQYHYTCYLPTFGGPYVFTLFSNNPIFNSLSDFTKCNENIINFNDKINIQIQLATPEDISYSLSYYVYHPEELNQGNDTPDIEAKQKKIRWFIIAVIIIIVIVIIVSASSDDSSSSSSSSNNSGGGGGNGPGGNI